MNFKNVCVVSLSNSKTITKNVCKYLKIKQINVSTSFFADGEIIVKPDSTVRHNTVVVIHSLCKPVNESIMELLICIDSLKRASAKEIIVVLTYYAYARQDRKVSGREPITAKLLANLIETAGANRIICVDIHSEQIQGFFNVPFDSVSFLPVLLYEIINKVKTKNLAIVSPDYGGVKRARNLAKILNCDLAILNKYRPKPNVAEITNILGDVRNKNCLIVDDMIDTAGTITSACKVIKQNGAKSISIAAIHGVLSTIAIERIKKCFDTKIIDNLFLTNTIPYVYNTGLKKITIIDISKFLADVISVICSNDDSLSTLLNNYVKKINEKKTNN